MYSEHHRGQGRSPWPVKAIAFSLAAAGSGIAAGLAFGWLGGVTPAETRIVIATLLAGVGFYLGVRETGIGPHAPRLLQRDRETPQRWMDYGPIPWAALNGAALGFGATTRIGTALWYAIPASALLIGDPLVGGAVYGCYGALRGGLVWGVLRLPRLLSEPPNTCSIRLIQWHRVVRQFSGAYLLLLSVATIIIVGL